MKTILLTLIIMLLSLPAFAKDKTVESTYERVTRTGEIRCGYAMWTPVFYKDLETNRLSGMFYDMMEEVGQRLDLKIVWAEESGWGTIVEGLHTGRYDMICSAIGYSSARVKFIDFGLPVFYTPLYAVTKKEDTRFDQDIRIVDNPKYKIAVLDGELSSVTARQVFPKASTVSMPQMNDYSMLLKEVEAGKADISLIEPSVFRNYEKTNPNLLKMLDHSAPINIFPVSVGLPHNDLAFHRMINVTLQELLNDGSIERIIQKYEEFPEAFVRVQKPYKTGR